MSQRLPDPQTLRLAILQRADRQLIERKSTDIQSLESIVEKTKIDSKNRNFWICLTFKMAQRVPDPLILRMAVLQRADRMRGRVKGDKTAQL